MRQRKKVERKNGTKGLVLTYKRGGERKKDGNKEAKILKIVQ